jgi:hypothetical protein
VQVIRSYYKDRRQPQAYDYPRLSEPTDNVIKAVIEMVRQTRPYHQSIPLTLEQTLVQHRNTAMTDCLESDQAVELPHA